MPDLDLSITICSWNTRDDLRNCLRSIAQLRDEAKLEVLVVDNASEDGSPDMVAADFPWVRLLAQTQNLGFGKGHNAAFEVAVGGVVMPLNSDTLLHEGALSKALAFLKDNPSVGILGPKLVNSNGTLQFSCRRFPTPLAALFRNTPLGRLFPKNRFTREYLMLDWAHDKPQDVDWVSGAAFFITRQALGNVTGFDERFFMYLEDVDICWRVHKSGLRVVYYPESVVTHIIGRSTDIVANKMICQFHDSMMLFYRKHYLPKTSPLLRWPAIGAGRTMLWLRQSLFISKNKIDDWKRRRGKL